MANYSVTCISSQEQQKMLVKSLITILGIQTHSKTEWHYLEEGDADIIIIDYDDGKYTPNTQKSNTQNKHVVSVAFSRDTNRLEGQRFSLQKPLRSRDLLTMLTAIDEHLTEKIAISQRQHPSRDTENDDPLDIIFSLICHNAQTMFSLHFDKQVAYLNPANKKIFISPHFSYAQISKHSDFQYHSLPEFNSTGLKLVSVADFFYEFTLKEKNAHLLAVLDSDSRFQIKQWPNFANNQNTKAVIKISAYFSKQKATLQTAAQDLSLDVRQLFGFINAVHAQNLLMFDTPVTQNHVMPVAAPSPANTVAKDTTKVSGLFGRIRQRLGL